jgi:hypothetical protein
MSAEQFAKPAWQTQLRSIPAVLQSAATGVNIRARSLGTFDVGVVFSEGGFDPSSPVQVTALAGFPSQATNLGDDPVARYRPTFAARP